VHGDTHPSNGSGVTLKVFANTVGAAFSKNPEVACGTVNKAIASFRVGELRLKGLRMTPSGWRGYTAERLQADPEA